jgi:lipopolysaccharide transport system ATP-binding protein
MSDIALAMEHVFKKFRKGEMLDSLRDFIPTLWRQMVKATNQSPLDKKEFWALQDISFEVRRGEAFGIIGSNGAGKSTMLKLLSGIMKPTSGSIRVNGSLSALIEVGAGFHPDLTGRENIYLNGTILGMSRHAIKQRLDEIVEFSGLQEFIDTPVKRYSSGMYARLGFSVAAHVEPDILIVDEVLSVGDYVFQRKCAEKMTTVLSSGTTVVFVSHNLKAVAELCRNSLLLERGAAVEIGPTERIVRNYLDRASDKRHDVEHMDAYVAKVSLRGKEGEQTQFTSGEKVRLDIEVVANRDVEKVAVVLEVKDSSYYEVFNTSTERLGHGTVSLKAGERYLCSYELDLHMGWGTFYLGVWLYRYDVQKMFDRLFPAVTFFVNSPMDVRGAVNLYPSIVSSETIH